MVSISLRYDSPSASDWISCSDSTTRSVKRWLSASRAFCRIEMANDRWFMCDSLEGAPGNREGENTRSQGARDRKFQINRSTLLCNRIFTRRQDVLRAFGRELGGSLRRPQNARYANHGYGHGDVQAHPAGRIAAQGFGGRRLAG